MHFTFSGLLQVQCIKALHSWRRECDPFMDRSGMNSKDRCVRKIGVSHEGDAGVQSLYGLPFECIQKIFVVIRSIC